MGHRVTGSDSAFHPPMGPALEAWGVETAIGYDASHLTPAPDLVVVGNVCTRDNPEAQAARLSQANVVSMPEAIERLLLQGRPGYVICGSHGKTTASSLVAHLLTAAGLRPGFLIGGMPLNFEQGFLYGNPTAPFIIEGDEYDSAYFEKQPKFWRYPAEAALLTSVEHDHIDIYPTMAAYREAFLGFVQRMPRSGVLVANAGDREVRELAKYAPCRVIYYGMHGQNLGGIDPLWMAAPAGGLHGQVHFDLFAGGTLCGRVASPLLGNHNILNAVGAMAMAAHAADAPISGLIRSLRTFRGVKRRQELLGVADGVFVYDDFAHHPSAVKSTLEGLREKHPTGKLVAIFEPRSATACRNLHQDVYPEAFCASDFAILAPLGRMNIPENERLDIDRLARAIGSSCTPLNVQEIIREACDHVSEGDAIVIMSNGMFDNLHDRLLVALSMRARARRGAVAREVSQQLNIEIADS